TSDSRGRRNFSDNPSGAFFKSFRDELVAVLRFASHRHEHRAGANFTGVRRDRARSFAQLLAKLLEGHCADQGSPKRRRTIDPSAIVCPSSGDCERTTPPPWISSL